ncbi:MAG: zinc-dependent metalloprotease [Actinobacteria bacterium]|nr:zinc-dependent metalloprotease [Actinomycetota bacterium]MCL5447355.1 zinc-dependent metalloprotease [Actinomycetota bacterium]
MKAPVAWEAATRLSRWAASCPLGPPRNENDCHPMSLSEYDRLEGIFDKASARAEELVVEHTGLIPLMTKRPCFEVVDRQQWSERNIATFRTILDRAFEDNPSTVSGGAGGIIRGMLSGPSSWITGSELGIMIGWLSYRVLGQYDLFAGSSRQYSGTETVAAPGSVYYVGPNVLSMQRKYGFDLYPFGLWIALHETTHRCQLEGVPWLKSYLLGIVDNLLSQLVSPEPDRIVAAVKRASSGEVSPRKLLAQGGLVTLLADDMQLENLRKLQAAMSLLEGHGDVVMDDAAVDIREEAVVFSRVLKERRRSGGIIMRFFQELLGINAKLLQYEKGAAFLRELQRTGGQSILSRLWEEPANLPSLDELEQPTLWLDRMEARAVHVH